MKVELHEQSAPRQCPYCHGALGAEGLRACGACGTAYHGECAAEVAKCAVLGCGGSFAAPGEALCRRCHRSFATGDEETFCHACGVRYHATCSAEGSACLARPCPGVLMRLVTAPRHAFVQPRLGPRDGVPSIFLALFFAGVAAMAVFSDDESTFARGIAVVAGATAVSLLAQGVVKLLRG